ncbi:hypothetical protein [Dactylosporangium sp. CA-139066]|uniref:hypothetical protein n=1 Tax=Dactylosporangium sp. CA-139066 TaxID=3239930 RepID=UPI003D91F328
MRWKTIIGLAVIGALAIVGVIVFVLQRGPDGAASPESAVSDYVAALKANDRGRLENIADPDHDASTEIPARLRQLGAGRLVVTGTAIGTTESDSQRPVDITGTVEGSPYSDRLWLYRHDGRWFIALGPNRNAHPKGT